MVRRIVQNFATRLGTALLSFGVVWLTAHYLGAEGRGAVSLFVTDCALLLLFIGLLGGSSLIYLAPRRNIWHLLVPAYLWAALVCLVGTGVVGALRQPGLAYLGHLGGLSVLQALFSINTSLLLGRRQETAYNLLTVVQVALLAAALAAAGLLPAANRSIGAYYAASYLAFGLPLLLSFWYLRRLPDRRVRMRRRLRATVRELGRHSRQAHFSNILAFVNYRLSYYFVAHFADLRQVGILSVGVALMEAIWLIPRSAALVQYVDLVHTSAPAPLPGAALRVARLTVLGTATAVVGLVLVPGSVLGWVFGPEFAAAKPVMLLLAPGAVVMALHMLISSYFAGKAHYGINNAAAVVGLVVTVAACAGLIPSFGIRGAALAATLSYSASAAFLLYQFRQATGAGLGAFLPRPADFAYLWQRGRPRRG